MLRPLLAALLALLVAVQTTGALAVSHEPRVHCCCGDHSVLRACHCRSCPVTVRPARQTARTIGKARPCDGSTVDGRLVIVSTRAHRQDAIEAPRFAVELGLTDATPLCDRSTEPDRPPP